MTVLAPIPRQDTRQWRARVAHAFSRAAPRYRQRATAQQAMCEQLWPFLPDSARHILDLGCGPGDLTARLAQHYRHHGYIAGLDLAPGMLQEARQQHGEHIQWLCGDAQSLPHADASLDLVVSNLAIQWCPALRPVFEELYRVLAPGGCAVLNTLGPGTLHEVDHAWSRPDQPAALLPFRSLAAHQQTAEQAGFVNMHSIADSDRFYYPDIGAVMTSIKGVGAQVGGADRAVTRHDLVRATQRYEMLRLTAGLPVTYQRITLILER